MKHCFRGCENAATSLLPITNILNHGSHVQFFSLLYSHDFTDSKQCLGLCLCFPGDNVYVLGFRPTLFHLVLFARFQSRCNQVQARALVAAILQIKSPSSTCCSVVMVCSLFKEMQGVKVEVPVVGGVFITRATGLPQNSPCVPPRHLAQEPHCKEYFQLSFI